jgi:hypothetical protein
LLSCKPASIKIHIDCLSTSIPSFQLLRSNTDERYDDENERETERTMEDEGTKKRRKEGKEQRNKVSKRVSEVYNILEVTSEYNMLG